MRVLVVSNFYPPHYVGGYEIACSEAVRGLADRGHEVIVLTSTYGVGRRKKAAGVYRWLLADVGWVPRPSVGRASRVASAVKQEVVNQTAFRSILRGFGPNVVYFWNLTFISVSLVFLTSKLRIPMAFQVSDYSLLHWRNDAYYTLMSTQGRSAVARLAKRSIRALARGLGLVVPSDRLPLDHAHFLSGFLQRALQAEHLCATSSSVIPWGVDPGRFSYRSETAQRNRILYVGQIVPHKGVQTLIEALRVLRDSQNEPLTLTLAGGSVIPEYESAIRQLVSSLGLSNCVHFLGHVAREKLPEVYAQHDILVFPSVWDEPFGITLLEAMASGLAVVATASGGSAEILKHDNNALIFPKEDAAACADRIAALATDPALFERIRRSGRRIVERDYRLDVAVEKTERALYQALM